MHANNEVGTIQPIQELCAISHEAGAAFHCDAAQSIGKIKVDVQELGVDLLSIAGHKFYAPKGVGALFIRNGIEMKKITYGAGHERNLRPGTENILEIAGLGAAAEIVNRDLLINQQHLLAMRDKVGIWAFCGTWKRCIESKWTPTITLTEHAECIIAWNPGECVFAKNPK